MLLCERNLPNGVVEKKIFCSGLDEFNCWPPVFVCTQASTCTSAQCGKEILPGNLIVKYPTTLHYECFLTPNINVRCVLCEEEILPGEGSASIKICGTFGFKHDPPCLSTSGPSSGRTSAENSQETSSIDSDLEVAAHPQKKRKH